MEFVDKWVVSHQPDFPVVENRAPVGVVSLTKLRRLPKGSWPGTPLCEGIRGNIPQAWPDELIDEVLERMTDQSVAVVPILKRRTKRFLGSVTKQDILDLVALIYQVDQATQRDD